ncbi:Uncharacterised protein [Vibrio cholerae]|nr:Uncharacterised protein [Vibrio cholerae]
MLIQLIVVGAQRRVDHLHIATDNSIIVETLYLI